MNFIPLLLLLTIEASLACNDVFTVPEGNSRIFQEEDNVRDAVVASTPCEDGGSEHEVSLLQAFDFDGKRERVIVVVPSHFDRVVLLFAPRNRSGRVRIYSGLNESGYSFDLKFLVNVHQSPFNADFIILNCDDHFLVTVDGGKNWHVQRAGFKTQQEFKFNKWNHLAVKSTSNHLWCSIDFAENWFRIQENRVYTFEWSREKAFLFFTTHSHDLHRLVIVHNKSGVFTDSVRVMSGVCSFGVASKYLYIAKRVDVIRREVYVSEDSGNIWSSTQLPSLTSDRFYVVASVTNSSRVYMRANGTLYASNEDGVWFKEAVDDRDTVVTYNRTLNAFTVLDHGSLIVAISAHKVEYSTNYGTCWHRINKYGHHLNTIFGHDLSSYFFGVDENRKKLKLLSVDFKSILKYECSDADYEDVTLDSNYCIGGVRTVTRRRKKQSMCFNSKNELKQQSCLCTQDDFTCDYGFVRNGSMCAFDRDAFVLTHLYKILCDSKLIQQVSTSGYRKKTGNKCEGGFTVPNLTITLNQSCSFHMETKAVEEHNATKIVLTDRTVLHKTPILYIVTVVILLLAASFFGYFKFYSKKQGTKFIRLNQSTSSLCIDFSDTENSEHEENIRIYSQPVFETTKASGFRSYSTKE